MLSATDSICSAQNTSRVSKFYMYDNAGGGLWNILLFRESL